MNGLVRDEVERILEVLLRLRTDPTHPGTKNGCWCEKGVDNPNFKTHTGACLAADALSEDLRDRLGLPPWR